jgi:hypothetical protein
MYILTTYTELNICRHWHPPKLEFLYPWEKGESELRCPLISSQPILKINHFPMENDQV